MRTFMLTAAFICITQFLAAQSKPIFSPIKDDEVVLRNWQKLIKDHFVNDSVGSIGENKKYYREFYRERYDHLSAMFTSKQLISSTNENAYLQKIVAEIVQGNPELKALELRVIFNRAYWPNAASTGEGTIVFNLGMFVRLENEAQAAFIICHELAHLYLDHSGTSLNQYINTVYSEEFQKELKKIKKSTYEKNKQLDQLEKGITFKSRRHGRSHESEADATALKFFKNTHYSIKESVKCLASLDSIDNEHYVAESGLPRTFNFSSYPFKKNWLKKDNGFFGNAATEVENKREADSLKTHPDCQLRVAALKPMVDSVSKPGSLFVVSETDFKKFQEEFRYEIIAYLYQDKSISKALYYSLALLEEHPQDPYLITMVGNCLNSIYKNQKEHTLGKIVDLPSPLRDKNYNSLLNFIQVLQLSDIAAISYNFLEGYRSTCASYPEFETVYQKSKELNQQ